MFKFGFSNDDAAEDSTDDTVEQNNLDWFECREILCKEVKFQASYNSNSINCNGFQIKHISDEDVMSTLRQQKTADINNSVIKADQNHSDLIPAVYEGGLKIWECTFDLLNFLSNENIDLNNKKILDLGCGAGIIGIYASLKGGYTVFQDYNIEVIQNITIPNVHLNNINFEKCKFYSGDWGSFLHLQNKNLEENQKYDFIFTSETIYNLDNYKKISNIFRHLLKENGIVYLAAKCHYFGVGGGLRDFEDTLRKEDIFNLSTCWVCPSGIKREIIKITLK